MDEAQRRAIAQAEEAELAAAALEGDSAPSASIDPLGRLRSVPQLARRATCVAAAEASGCDEAP